MRLRPFWRKSGGKNKSWGYSTFGAKQEIYLGDIIDETYFSPAEAADKTSAL